MKRIFTVLLTLVILCSCASVTDEPADAQQSDVFSEVFNDGLIKLETRRLLRLAGSETTEYCFLEIRLTNSDVVPIYFSSLLSVRAASRGTELPTKNAAAAHKAAAATYDGYSQLDGVIPAGSTAQGFIFFEAPLGTCQFDISIATDCAADKWISFSCSAESAGDRQSDSSNK